LHSGTAKRPKEKKEKKKTRQEKKYTKTKIILANTKTGA